MEFDNIDFTPVPQGAGATAAQALINDYSPAQLHREPEKDEAGHDKEK
jgi:hypothetical protein